MSTVRLLTFFAPLSDPRYPTCSEFAFGSRTCFTLATTESALNGSPSVNLTPGRSLNRHADGETRFGAAIASFG
jgi:hypothetical protein